MTSTGGYHGQFLRVDLTSGRSTTHRIPEDVLRAYIGGTGLGVRLLLDAGAAGIDPFDAAAPLAFVFSPLVGSPLTTSAKFAVAARSPLTGLYNDSLASSRFAISGKAVGVDAILLVGQATKPSILIIDEHGVRLQPAGKLWGQSIPDTEEALRQQLGSAYQSAVIGPAGEQLVRFATISHDGRHAGRGGHGAVLGAKRLKAIAVKGKKTTGLHNRAELYRYARELSKKSLGPGTAKYRELGTVGNLAAFDRLSVLPTTNFQTSRFAGVQQLTPTSSTQLDADRPQSDNGKHIRRSCAACNIGCEHIYEIDGNSSVRLEYESLFALGSMCGVADQQSVLQAVKLCNELGIDTISAGGTIALAMECAEAGWFDVDWLRFGDGDAMLAALKLIGSRDGIGEQLAEGSRRLAEAIGPEAISIAPQVKGLELPGYEPRNLQTLALGLATAARGADHNRSGAYESDFAGRTNRFQMDDRSVDEVIASEDRAAIMDSLILCKFIRHALDDLYADGATMLTLVSGWSVDDQELKCTAKRIVDAKKMFNLQAGWQPETDILPKRFFEDDLAHGEIAPVNLRRFQELVHDYYRLRGWLPDGGLSHQRQQELTTVSG